MWGEEQGQDLADKALANEFADYIAEVSNKIFEPVKNYERTIKESSERIKESIAVVAQGHEVTRQKLIVLLEEHRDFARDATRQQAAWLKSEIEPKLAELTEPIAGLMQTLNTQNIQANKALYVRSIAHIDKSIEQLKMINESSLQQAKEEMDAAIVEKVRIRNLLRISIIFQAVMFVAVLVLLFR